MALIRRVGCRLSSVPSTVLRWIVDRYWWWRWGGEGSAVASTINTISTIGVVVIGVDCVVAFVVVRTTVERPKTSSGVNGIVGARSSGRYSYRYKHYYYYYCY